MIDHVSIAVRELLRSAAIYEQILAPLGLQRLIERDGSVGFGKKYPEFWLNLRSTTIRTENPGTHICLRAPSNSAVQEFHAAAMAANFEDAGEPGPRQAAMTSYFAAFFVDADGNKIEAACFPRPSNG